MSVASRSAHSSSRAIPFPGGAAIFRRMFARLGIRGRAPHFEVAFYPYASLSHTIRLRDETANARLSDLMRGAPLDALEAAAAILLAKIYRRHLPAEMARRYRRYAESGRVNLRIEHIRRRRGRRKHTGAEGHVHHLDLIFQRLNAEYFSARLPATDLGWSASPWRRQLGVFDPGMRHIVINSRLDRPGVPGHVVAYVVYHEMLHLERALPVRLRTRAVALARRDSRCRLGLHTREFRLAERRFREFDQARRYLLRAGLW
ncbi:MAG TPA: hypothetical protein VLW54_00970 [Candidatus Acidoferrales bacterium]|nr:hypothetical protein [Candidatus Acidoferrales bacterium]